MRDAVRIDGRNLDRLAAFLARFDSPDPYALSPAYFAVTGRRGLWLYETPGGGVIVAVHPNLSRMAIVFAPYGSADAAAGYAALEAAGIARDWVSLWGRIPGGAPGSEKLLDWRYPVRVLGTDALRTASGERFRDYRKNLNRAEREGLSYRLFDLARDGDTVVKITSQWAWSHQAPGFSFGDLISPTMRALFVARMLPVAGVVVERAGVAVGFALWEETRQGLANGISGVLAPPVRGGSEFLIKAQVEVLADRGFSELCIGGSETGSLDAFKRKLCPVRSVVLGSRQEAVGQVDVASIAA